ncbi:MAG: DUF4870 domain-containing protein [Negativicutes bacterium]|nr:DUF4870 domain-containing protein [Negativicutes bacterium]
MPGKVPPPPIPGPVPLPPNGRGVGGPPPPPPVQGMPPVGNYSFKPATYSGAYDKTSKLGLQNNVAATLSYVFGWVTGLIFFFLEKDRFIRFHAAQSLLFFGAVQVLNMLLAFPMGGMLSFLWDVLSMLKGLVSLGSFVIWILLMYKTYNGEYYKLPIVGDYAEKLVKNSQT